MNLTITYRDMTLADYEAVLSLWKSAGFTIRPRTDTREGIERLLLRNPGLSIVAESEGNIIGCALGSHDGRRGFLQHVAVSPSAQGQGVGRQMVDLCLAKFKSLDLGWVHLDVAEGNTGAMQFWRGRGWQPREELTRLSLCILDG